ncbi:site-2 protease family protein [Thermomicrobiaceae bacterium CFH 74404]|uniref:Zinc metalloprotease n=1 Tax=Thermalbibacter longus TaxID=2951981 RepID=A0AA42B9I2_9BACT|nr:site-2 protease family protein [Thermalbibacter longus]MCM8748651.1 site-2 protease family protein [Thermalbibacter longus]
MGRGFRIGKIGGVEVRVHPTVVIALLWVFWHWGRSAHDPLVGALFGGFLLLAVFVSVAGHELAHSFLAQRYGLEVQDITLLPIGGVARIEQTPLSPRSEAMVALAGPLLNLVVAAGLTPALVGMLLWRGVREPLDVLLIAQETSPSSLLLLVWLANMLLALFNLLPAFPMDGGRILRAWLSWMSDRLMATRIAVSLGYLLALGLLIAGILLRDLMLPLLALFLLAAATVEARLIEVEQAMQRLPVGQFAVWDMGGVGPDQELRYALRGGPRDVAVVSGGKVVGMLWREDILRNVQVGSRLLVREVMDPSVVTVNVDTSVYDAHQRMLASGHPSIPVVEHGRYRGIFTADRLVHVYRYLQEGRRPRDRYLVIAEALGLIAR